MSLLVCPHCLVEMKTVDREGVDVDICTHCQGVWLDKGKLEQILEASHHNREQKKQGTKKKGLWSSLLDIF